jgi:hypothetical protein
MQRHKVPFTLGGIDPDTGKERGKDGLEEIIIYFLRRVVVHGVVVGQCVIILFLFQSLYLSNIIVVE